MNSTIGYLGLSARDFTEISAARKEVAASSEFRFFTSATELLDHVTYASPTPMLMFLDTRALDEEWELLRRLKNNNTSQNLQMVLVSPEAKPAEMERARACAVPYLQSPLGPETLRRLLKARVRR